MLRNGHRWRGGHPPRADRPRPSGAARRSPPPRGGTVRDELGAGWYRDLHFVIPVLEPAFWRARVDALTSALEFLTGDRFSFDFKNRNLSARQQPTLPLPGGIPRVDEVVLFSGGLDSLAGALELLSNPARKVLLVTHRSANKTARVQKNLAQKLQARFGDRVLWVPALGTLVKDGAREATQRSENRFSTQRWGMRQHRSWIHTLPFLRERHRQHEPPSRSPSDRKHGNSNNPSSLPGAHGAPAQIGGGIRCARCSVGGPMATGRRTCGSGDGSSSGSATSRSTRRAGRSGNDPGRSPR